MAELHRSIRCAHIEYQPNLQRPTQAYPLGVLVEEGPGDDRRIILLGRPSLNGLDLGNVWGPFRDVVTNWFEAFSRNIDELVKSADPKASVIDGLARQWRSTNVYVKQPETKATRTDLNKAGNECYEGFVREDASRANLYRRAGANYREAVTA